MDAALPTLPPQAPGVAVSARADDISAGRVGGAPAFGFLDQMARVLGQVLGQTLGVSTGKAAAQTPPRDPAARGAPAGTGAPAPAASGGAQQSVVSVQNGSVPAQDPLAASQVLPRAVPVPTQAAVPGAGAPDGARAASRPGERRAAASRSGAGDGGSSRAGAPQDQPADPAVHLGPLPVAEGAAPAGAMTAPGTPPADGAAVGRPAESVPGVVERSAVRHESLPIAAAEAPQAGVRQVAPPESFAQHAAAAAPSGLDRPEAVAAQLVQASAPSVPGAALLGVGAGVAHAEPAAPSAPAGPAHPTSPSPTAQLTPALVHIAAAPGGAQHITVRLDPVELGEVRVHIERSREGPVQVTVEVSRPETLQLLRQDQPALHRALDQAGLAQEGRVVVLQQAAPDPPRPRAADAGGLGSASAGDGQQGSSRSGSQSWNGPGSGGPGAPGQQETRQNAWLRAGLDITA